MGANYRIFRILAAGVTLHPLGVTESIGECVHTSVRAARTFMPKKEFAIVTAMPFRASEKLPAPASFPTPTIALASRVTE